MPFAAFFSVGALRRRIAVSLLTVSASGCLSQSYEISAPELERLVQLPPDERGVELRVTQQTMFGSDVGDVEVAQLAEDDPDFALMLAVGSSDHHRHRGRHHHQRRYARDEAGESGDDVSADDAAEQALAAAVVAVAVASTLAVSIAATEGARFDGWMAAPAEHPVLLIEGDGSRRWTRLEALSEDDLRGVERGVLPDLAGDLDRLERHPLDRAGFVYQLEFGAERAALDTGLAMSARAGLGHMPTQRFGVLFGGAFSTSRTDGAARSELMVDYRLFLQGELWPLALGRLHAGAYAELGYAWALRDDEWGSQEVSGPSVALGAALQLDWTTRLAVTLRMGAAWLPSLDVAAGGATAGYRLSPALTLGAAIY